MNIDLSLVPTLWYENKDGKRYVPTIGEDPPEEFIYQHTQIPNLLRHSVFREVVKAEVDACPHATRYIRETFGWIDSIEGRECITCKGTQVKEKTDDWPTEWDANGSREILVTNASWGEDLVLAIIGSFYSLRDAILIVANACERCSNVLAYTHRVGWGYAEGSDDWKAAGTSCIFCEEKK